MLLLRGKSTCPGCSGSRNHLNVGRLGALVPEAGFQERRAAWRPPEITHQTTWQEIWRHHLSQFAHGGRLELATAHKRIGHDQPRDNH